MKKKIIIGIVAIIAVVGIIVTVVLINNSNRQNGLNPANPATISEIASTQRGTLTVGNATASAGDEVKLAISIKDNPGILGMTLKVNYITHALTLTDSESGEALKDVLTFTKPGNYQNNCNFLWDGMEIKQDQIADGEVLILTFKVSDNAEPGDYPILLSYEKDAIVDRNLNIIDLDIVDGSIKIE